MKLVAGVAAPILTVSIALTGLLGAGPAAAEPGHPCGAPDKPVCGPAAQNGNWQQRGIDQARGDHQPFQYNGHRVEPLRAGNGDGWGFWFLGQWIRL